MVSKDGGRQLRKLEIYNEGKILGLMEGENSEGRTPLEEARSWGISEGFLEMEVAEAMWM